MNEALKTLPLPTWLATPRSTSSQASEAGALPCDSQDGPRTDPCGPAVAPANLSARQAKEMGLLTSGTYGHHGSISSASADLQSSLVSRLKQQLTTSGSTLFKMTWREKVMPSGRLVFLLRASGHRTSGNDYGSWPTPLVNDTSGSTHCYSGKNPDGTHKIALKLPGAVQLAPWPTAAATDGMRGGTMTPNMTGVSLTQVASLAPWPTPNCPMKHDSDHSAFRWNPNKKQDDPVTLILGRTQSLSDVPMEKRGQLNPRFSLWLMGYPTGWASCGEQVTLSSRRSRQK